MTETRVPSFRRWWRPPKGTEHHDDHRQVTFLELFYDLVYVVVIAEVAHFLATHVSWTGVFEAAFLFTLVWIAWLNGTLYHDIHGQNDVRTRTFTFLQMFTVAAMAVFAHSAFGEGASGFALSFAAYQVVVGFLWWRTGVHEPAHRPLSAPYSASIFLSAALFATSAFVSDTLQLPLWGGGLAVTALAPLAVYLPRTDDPGVIAQRERTLTITASTVERFGLFAIIVLGEVIVAVVQGVAGHHDLTWTVGATAALGMLIAFSLWWLYFDFVSHRKPRQRIPLTFSWYYLHLVTTMGIAFTGAAVLNVVEHAGDPIAGAVRWLLVTSIAVTAATIALTIWVVRTPEPARRLFRTAGWVTFVSAGVILALGSSPLDTIPLLATLVVLMLLPVFYGLRVWVTVLGAEEIPLD